MWSVKLTGSLADYDDLKSFYIMPIFKVTLLGFSDIIKHLDQLINLN